ncbi:MAG: choice-of-anchor U domain-containing protein, partial [Candidatus Thiodiazotropha sp.]
MPSRTILIGLVFLIFMQSAWSDTLTLPSESPTNETAFSIRVEGYRGSSPTYFEYLGAFVEGGEINVYGNVYGENFSVPQGYDEVIEIGPFPSGNYTVNYYRYARYDDEAPYTLEDSKPIEIVKVSQNEPAAGRVEIGGELTEDQLLTIDASLSDRNGMGALSYQWYRDGEPIDGAIYISHRLTDADVGSSLSVTATFEDGAGNREQLSSLRTMDPVVNVDDTPVGAIYLRGSVAEDAALSIDTSSLYHADDDCSVAFLWERVSPTNPDNRAAIIADSNTYVPTVYDVNLLISATVQYRSGDTTVCHVVPRAITTGPVVPAGQPVVVAPDDFTRPASGTLTEVDAGRATAQDDQGGELETYLKRLVSNGVEQALPSDPTRLYLVPGTHLLTWSVNVGEVRSGEAIQIVRVDPIIQFDRDRAASPAGPFECPLLMNGAPARYPVSVPYTLSAVLAADQTQHTLRHDVLIIDGKEQPPTIRIPDYMLPRLTEYQSLLLSMDQPTNAVSGEKPTCRIALSNENFAPDVTLAAEQNGTVHRIVAKTNGPVRVSASVEDLNADDTHTYDWSGTDVLLEDIDDEPSRLTLDPANLASGLYRVRVQVSDGSAITGSELPLLVVDQAPALEPGSDQDGDGISDLDEGTGDQDGDGIVDYLDPDGLPGNVLAQSSASPTEYLIETEPGLSLSLGDVAFFNQRSGAGISMGDIEHYIASGQGGVLDSDDYVYEAGLFDFRVEGIAGVGASVKVVLPQLQPIAADSVYRKQMPTGWQEFIVDSANTLKSARGSQGHCPSPGDNAYVDGLNPGDWCVELTVQDGGPNDADGEADGGISDPGGVTLAASSEDGVVFRILCHFYKLRLKEMIHERQNTIRHGK